jgi:predicted DNA-binding transcriptional regulator YafY
MKKKTLTRENAFNILLALQICQKLDVPSRFRYAALKMIPKLEEERKATYDAFGEAPAEDLDKHNEWEAGLKKHLAEEIEVEIYETELVEIDDTIHVEEKMRAQQNNALVAALMPVWKE